MLVSGCEIFNSDRILGENIVIMNETSETIEVFTIRDGVKSTLATIEPGQGYTIRAAQFTDGCLSGPLARSDDGTVVATREGELCSKDNWRSRPRPHRAGQKPQFGFGAVSSPRKAPPTGAMITLMSVAGCPVSLRPRCPLPEST